MSVGSSTGTVVTAAFGSSAAVAHSLTAADRLLKQPIPLSRRISFVGVGGGSGCSATAGYLASLYARRRAGMVLAVDAAAGPHGLLWHAGMTADEQSPVASARRSAARRASDARDGLPVTASGLYALGLAAQAPAQSVAPLIEWADEVSQIARFYDIVVTDWGVRPPEIDLAGVASLSHAVCLVARSDRASCERAAAAVPTLQAADEAPRIVLAVVDVADSGQRPIRLLGRRLDLPVLTIPYDRVRGARLAAGSAQLARPTRLAYVRLATALLEASQQVRSGTRARHPRRALP